MSTVPATPTKLKNGEWGVKIDRPFERGETVACTVTTRAGKTWDGDYQAIWTNGEITLAAPTGSPRKTRENPEENGVASYYDAHRFTRGEARLMTCGGCGKNGKTTIADYRKNGGIVHAECIATADSENETRHAEAQAAHKAHKAALPQCTVAGCGGAVIDGECEQCQEPHTV